VNASLLAGYSQGKIVYGSIPVKWSKAGGSTKLACVQGHQYLENERIRTTGEGHRKILQDAFLEQFNTEGDDSWKIPYHMPTDISIWRQKFNDSTTHKWAMAIDTNTCTGCGSCMVSCQAENNISVVGKDEVLINREMHWIRIDRYYTAADGNHPEHTDEVDVVQQPMLCQHCDNAPCETVCPVVATTHNEEGLNVQTYNRCVGTRYCSNNCPYKVRHYNWYDYSDYRAGLHQSGRPLTRLLRQVGIKGKELKDKTEYPLMLQFNPDVTVRSRGVMEKCSFCVHKIRRWHTDERALGRDLPEAQKQTACQQACPADAITFGNILDENSAVSKVVEKKGAYKVLKELNTEANVTYLTRLRNRAMPEGSADAHGSHGETAHH
jgi:molybdopterin-containing oxidoreductase family iron-sulfur binding subunit